MQCQFMQNVTLQSCMISWMVPQGDVCIFYNFRNLCLLDFQLSDEFISFCPPERQKVLNQVTARSVTYSFVLPQRDWGFFHYLWKIILLDTKFGEQFMCLCPPKHLSKSKLSLPLFKPISSTHLFKQMVVLKLLRTSFVSYIWTINY